MSSASRAVPLNAAAPIGEMNTTPLIDVLLVLLVMMIITIPIQSHQVPVDLPQGGPASAPVDKPHKLSIDARGVLFWDGAPVTDTQLPGLLAPLADAGTTLHMQTDPETRYDRFDQVLAIVKKQGITQLGFVGNQPFPD
ncbi:biopolymer transporter ExbD [Sphingomonas sp. G-3-2-10]|uniref:ExbD/TolR family protein n=1 Tax=Sphingomonas sp. G-3-2-10 TaxID=2728838 RepID=UPI00146C5EEB|nr:biopolymer transporter ExbD [Sphingomonas sp. G-3-2-10]NML06979.1 biopolymer transporter ExbD [Sphingomonas sp. G-3-2-10]